jgi:hypothetical protein
MVSDTKSDIINIMRLPNSDQLILDAAKHVDAEELGADTMGRRWRIDVAVSRQNRRVMVRTLWIMRPDENAPRFVTCWVL